SIKQIPYPATSSDSRCRMLRSAYQSDGRQLQDRPGFGGGFLPESSRLFLTILAGFSQVSSGVVREIPLFVREVFGKRSEKRPFLREIPGFWSVPLLYPAEGSRTCPAFCPGSV